MIISNSKVYQENIYKEQKFVSLKKVVCDMKSPVNLVSFHSCSKGLVGECGLRGGYMELHNLEKDVFEQIFKLKCINLCSNTMGQIATDLLINPPTLENGASEFTVQEHQTEMKKLFNSL